MAGNALAGLAAKLGTRAAGAVGGAKGSMFGVAQEAVKGQYAAEAQERAHGHTRQLLKDVHKNASGGTGVRVRIKSGDSENDLGYTKQQSGERYADQQEGFAMQDARKARKNATNPTRDANGFRRDHPDHVGNARAAIENKGMAPTSLVAVKGTPKAAKAKTQTVNAEEAPDSTRQFVNDPKTGTRSVDRKDSSFAANLDANESKYLAEKTARLNTIKQAGSGIKPTKPAENDELF